jgi:5,10-methylene-tetrahydrofolate dehydrogenase/methenyl tetrahydrofolate cyclohydrolase
MNFVCQMCANSAKERQTYLHSKNKEKRKFQLNTVLIKFTQTQQKNSLSFLIRELLVQNQHDPSLFSIIKGYSTNSPFLVCATSFISSCI